jgi:hypothetical protein
MAKKFIKTIDLEVSDSGVLSVSLGNRLVVQGERVVGAATVQLVTASTPCSQIWFGAPTAVNNKGGTNTSTVLIGQNKNTNASGGVYLAAANAAGLYYPCDDASKVYLTGGTAGDVVEYQIFQ